MTLTTGQSRHSITGASTTLTPGKMPPASMRTASSIAWAAANRGSTCTAWDGTLNHSRRRWIVMAKKLRMKNYLRTYGDGLLP